MRHPLTHVGAGRYRTRTARAERSEGNQSPSGALISARFPTHRNVYQERCRQTIRSGDFFVVGGTGREQHGTAAGGATNTPVGCLLVRGFQRSGMSTGDDAQKSSWSENSLKSLSPLSVVCSRSVAKFGEERQNGSENPIFADFWV